MPYKNNESRRHKIEKSRYRVTNWHEYNNGLRRRGDFTIWFTEAAIAEWRPTRTEARGRPQEYSNIAIEGEHKKVGCIFFKSRRHFQH